MVDPSSCSAAPMSDICPSIVATEASAPQYTPPSYRDVVEIYGLDILKGGADFSIENGGLNARPAGVQRCWTC